MILAVRQEQLIFIQTGKRLDFFCVFLYNYTREKKIEKALTKTVVLYSGKTFTYNWVFIRKCRSSPLPERV